VKRNCRLWFLESYRECQASRPKGLRHHRLQSVTPAAGDPYPLSQRAVILVSVELGTLELRAHMRAVSFCLLWPPRTAGH
jgi:hypothetical protein